MQREFIISWNRCEWITNQAFPKYVWLQNGAKMFIKSHLYFLCSFSLTLKIPIYWIMMVVKSCFNNLKVLTNIFFPFIKMTMWIQGRKLLLPKAEWASFNVACRYCPAAPSILPKPGWGITYSANPSFTPLQPALNSERFWPHYILCSKCMYDAFTFPDTNRTDTTILLHSWKDVWAILKPYFVLFEISAVICM